MKAIIFGANGQDGYYLHEICKVKVIEVIGVSRSGDWVCGDVSSYKYVEELIIKHLPSYIFHLAANSTTRHDALFENHATISTGTLNILEAAKIHCPNAKVFITGSGVQFKNEGQPISESDPFEASSPYAISRIQSVYAARYYRSLGMKTYVGYLFHHESEMRKPNHVSQKIVLAAKRIAAGSDEILELGDITVEKEWTYAGDVVKGILTLVEQDNIFEATIGSGVTYTIKDWLDVCFGLLGLGWRDRVQLKDKFVSEYNRLVSNPNTINSIGWFPSVTLENLAKIMLNIE